MKDGEHRANRCERQRHRLCDRVPLVRLSRLHSRTHLGLARCPGRGRPARPQGWISGLDVVTPGIAGFMITVPLVTRAYWATTKPPDLEEPIRYHPAMASCCGRTRPTSRTCTSPDAPRTREGGRGGLRSRSSTTTSSVCRSLGGRLSRPSMAWCWKAPDSDVGIRVHTFIGIPPWAASKATGHPRTHRQTVCRRDQLPPRVDQRRRALQRLTARYPRRPDQLEPATGGLDALPKAVRAELLHVLMLPDLERVERIGGILVLPPEPIVR